MVKLKDVNLRGTLLAKKKKAVLQNPPQTQDSSPQSPPPQALAIWQSPVFWLFGLALLIRFVHFVLYRNDFWLKTPLLDDNIFMGIAAKIEKEGWLARSVGPFDFNPAYPYLLFLIGKIIGRKVLTVIALQHCVGAIAVVLIYLIAEKFFVRKIAVVAGILAAIYGPSIFFETRLLGEFWIYFFNSAFLASIVLSDGAERPWIGWSVAGLCLGLSAIFRPTAFVCVPLALLWAVWRLRSNIRQMVMSLILFLITTWIPMVPFQIRNRLVDPTWGWGLTTASGGVNLYYGNNPEASGTITAPSFARMAPIYIIQEFQNEAQRRLGHPVTRQESSRYWTEEALAWVEQQPLAASRLLLRKFAYFCNYRDVSDNFPSFVFERFNRLGRWPLLAWGIMFPIGLAGLFWSLGNPEVRSKWLLHGYVVGYVIANVAFFIVSRYRIPAAAGLIPFASYAIVRLQEGLSSRDYKRCSALLVLVLGSMGFSRLHLLPEENAAATHYTIGVIYGRNGLKKEAIEEYRSAVALNPNFKDAYENMAILQNDLGETAGSINSFQNALRLESDLKERAVLQSNIQSLQSHLLQGKERHLGGKSIHPRPEVAHIKLGYALASQGHLDSAAHELELALKLNPNLPEVRANLSGVLNELGRNAVARGKLDEGGDLFNEAVLFDPNSPEARFNLGMYLGVRGKPDQALREFKEVLRINPKFEPARRKVELLERDGNIGAKSQHQWVSP